MIVIGADTHKSTHTVVAVEGRRAELLGDLTVRLQAQRASRSCCAGRSGLGRRARVGDRGLPAGLRPRSSAARSAAASGWCGWPPKLMAGALAVPSASAGKSDRIDALAIARAALREGAEHSAQPRFLDASGELRSELLVDHREDLVQERRGSDRLRWHLHDLWPEFELPAAGVRSRHGGLNESPGAWRADTVDPGSRLARDLRERSAS